MRLAVGYVGRGAVIPDFGHGAIAPHGTYEHTLSVPVGTCIWGFSGQSDQADGYEVQVTDIGARKSIWSQAVDYRMISGYGSFTAADVLGDVSTYTYGLHKLNKPIQVINPGRISIRVKNLSANPNTLEFVLHMGHPTGQGAPNQWNDLLDYELVLATRAKRQLFPTLNATGEIIHVPFDISAASNVVIAGHPGACIAIYAMDIWNVSEQDIGFYDGSDELRGPLASFPDQSGNKWDNVGRALYRLTNGRDFIITLSGPTRATGYVQYRME